MELTSLPLSSRTSLFAIVSLLPAIAAFVLLVAVGRGERGRLWLVPAWLAAAALAPLLATFVAVRQLIATFRAMATGGGIGSVAAGMSEAMQPIVAAAWLAMLLALVTLIMTMRAIGELEDEDGAARPPARAAVLAGAVLAVSIASVAASSWLFRSLLAIILGVLDPHATSTAGVATTSALVASRLVVAAGLSMGAMLALIVAIVLLLVMNRERLPAAAFARVLAFVTVLALLGAVANLAIFRGWSERLERIALTGQFGG